MGKRSALVLAIAAILLAGYASTLRGMVTQWWTDEDMGHGFVVPLAIGANAARVAVSASLPALDAGTPHLIAGWLIFVLCLATLVLARRVCQRVFARYHA